MIWRRFAPLMLSLLSITAGTVAAVLPALTGPAGDHSGTVRFRLVDVQSGETTTAMAAIRNLETDAVHLPPDGRVAKRVSRTTDFYRGLKRPPGDRDWVGPVRKMAGRGDNNDRSYVYEDQPSLLYWREAVMYQTPGDFTVTLPEGRYRISVTHGMEYVPVDKEFRVEAGAEQSHDVHLKRWIDLPERGWYSGDVHVHHPTVEPAHREFLLEYAKAEDVHVVNTLEMGHHKGTDFPQAGFGGEFRVRRGDYCLVSGQEEPRSQFGHIIGLNISSLARDLPTYDFYDLAFERIHAQPGAIVGFAHFAWNGCALPRGFPWYVTTEAIDFLELLQFNRLNARDYHDYLNLGFRFSAAAGSDIPWGSTLGEVRTFVHTGGELDIDAWFEGLAKGRTFVSNGPALFFTVDGELPGSELQRSAGDALKISARVAGHPRVGRPVRLMLHGIDGTIQEAEAHEERSTIAFTLEHRVTESQWLALSAVCDNGASAHTSPVYVIVDDEPTWNARKGSSIIDRQLEAISAIEKEFAPRRDAYGDGIRERLERARVFYSRLKAKMASSR